MLLSFSLMSAMYVVFLEARGHFLPVNLFLPVCRVLCVFIRVCVFFSLFQVTQLSKSPMRSPLAVCLLIRYMTKILHDDISATNARTAYQVPTLQT